MKNEQQSVDHLFYIEQISQLKQENNSLRAKLENQKKSNIKEEKQNDMFKKIFDTVQTGIVVLDADLNVIQTNFYAEKILTPHILNHYHITCLEQLQKGENKEILPTILTYQNHDSFNTVYEAPQNPAGIIWVSVRSFPLFDSFGKLTSIVEMFTDVSKQLQEAQKIEQNNLSFKSFVNEVNIGVYRTSFDGKILFCNNALAKMLGYNSAEDIQYEDADEIGYYEPEKRMQFLAKLQANQKLTHFDAVWKHRSGKPIYMLESANIIYEEEAQYIEGTIQDVSELKLVERALQQKNQILDQKCTFLTSILDRLPFNITVYDNYKKCVYRNLQAKTSNLDMGISTAVNRAFSAKSYAQFRELSSQTEQWFNVHAYPILNEKDDLSFVIELQQEEAVSRQSTVELNSYREQLEKLIEQRSKQLQISNANLSSEMAQRKLIQKKLEESEAMLQQVINHIPQYIVWKDRNANYLGCNKKFIEAFNKESIQDIVGKKDDDFIADEAQNDFNKIYEQKVIETGHSALHIVTEKEKDSAHPKYFDCNWIPLKNDNADVVGILHMFEDITKQKLAEELILKAKIDAENAHRLKSQFIFNVSHEIRTPLNSIMGYSELIQNADIDEKIKNYAEIILSQSDILLKLINQILDFAKIDSGKVTLQQYPFSVKNVIEAVLLSQQSKLEQKGLKAEFNWDENLSSCHLGDELKVQEILMNLVSNAVKFTEKGYIKVSVSLITQTENEQRIHFEVRDSGIGIAADKMDSIFESFTQADGNITRQFGGTGLGTTIAKQLVEKMEGRIGVRHNQQQGAIFWFEIPFAVCNKTDLSNKKIEFNPSLQLPEKSHILIVEDYQPNQDLLRHFLSEYPIELSFAENGEEAIQYCKKNEFDLILMDVQMPVMDGYHATIFIREEENQNQTKPIIGLTAHADTTTRQKSFEAGMNDLLTKPIRRRLLLDTISKWIYIQYGEEEKALESFDDDSVVISLDEVLPEFNYSLDIVLLIAKQFIENVEEQIVSMENALSTSDFEKIRTEVHKIKGGALNLAAKPLGNLAGLIEEKIMEDNFDKKLLHQFYGEFQRFKEKVFTLEKEA